MGDRVSASTHIGSTSTYTTYLVDPSGSIPQILAEYPNSGLPTYYIPAGTLIGQDQGTSGGLSYFATDGLGSVRGTYNTSGANVGVSNFDPYGATLPDYAVTGTGSHIGYTGAMTDANGLVYLNARYYDPADADFLSSDSLAGSAGDPGSFNLYGYVQGNPVNETDISGKRSVNITPYQDECVDDPEDCEEPSPPFPINIYPFDSSPFDPSPVSDPNDTLLTVPDPLSFEIQTADAPIKALIVALDPDAGVQLNGEPEVSGDTHVPYALYGAPGTTLADSMQKKFGWISIINWIGGGKNCAFCAVALDETLDTIDTNTPSFKLVPPQDKLGYTPNQLTTIAGLVGNGNTWQPESSFQDLETSLSSAPDGTKGIIAVTWSQGGGHMFNVIKFQGNIIYLDAQTNTISVNTLSPGFPATNSILFLQTK